MNDTHDNPAAPQPPPSAESDPSSSAAEQPSPGNESAPPAQPLSIEHADTSPLGLTPAAPAAPPIDERFPEDLRTPWGWPHLILFVVFTIGSFIVPQILLVIYLIAFRNISPAVIQTMPPWLTPYLAAVQLMSWVLIFLFLYISSRIVRGGPFWRSLGWRKLSESTSPTARRVGFYLLAGAGLSIIVSTANSFVHRAGPLPIEKLFVGRSGIVILLLFAVFVAPVVEETVFRGYLYPLFARQFGVSTSIIITGLLFGAMHGAQLGWTWGLVLLLSLVGVIFTYVRARTKTVLASYLLHLGYNSMIAISVAIGSKGFTQLPGGK
jgi:membrane protease YdiL (CAAX protease family)